MERTRGVEPREQRSEREGETEAGWAKQMARMGRPGGRPEVELMVQRPEGTVEGGDGARARARVGVLEPEPVGVLVLLEEEVVVGRSLWYSPRRKATFEAMLAPNECPTSTRE